MRCLHTCIAPVARSSRAGLTGQGKLACFWHAMAACHHMPCSCLIRRKSLLGWILCCERASAVRPISNTSTMTLQTTAHPMVSTSGAAGSSGRLPARSARAQIIPAPFKYTRKAQGTGNIRCAAAGTESAQELLERAAESSGADLGNGGSPVRFDGRAFRRGLNKTGRYVRQPSNDKESLALMEEHGVGYSSTGLIARMRQNGNTWQEGDVKIKLAQAYGYCWGVERAVQMAYEARKQYPSASLHVTNEIIHNPAVNQRLKEMDINIIEDSGDGKDFSGIKSEDVVILPAFGASVQEMKMLSERGVQLVDTTCPWVAKVWNAVDNQGRKEHTSIIHGKYSHEETIATASFATTYLIVRDLEEAQYVVDYILNGGKKEEFLAKFAKAISQGFDPDRDLVRIGLANQTTMLRDETLSIGKMLEKVMMQKYGPADLKQHYMVMDTICDATQERQDAVTELVAKQCDPKEAVDLMLVVGGFNSSNTSHLQEIPELAGVAAYWVNSAACVDVVRNKVTHKLAHGELIETEPWLKDGPITIGVTSGASTPDRAVEDVLDRVFRIKNPSFSGIAPLQKEAATVPPPRPEEAAPL